MDIALLAMDLAVAKLDLLAVLGLDGLGQPLLHGLDACLSLGLVDADHLAFLAHIDVQGLAQSDQEVLLVHLRMALHCLVLDAGGDLAQLGDRFVLQFSVRKGHKYLQRIGLDFVTRNA